MQKERGQKMTDKIKVCSMSELSRQTGVALYTIRKLVNDGRLPVLKIGNKYLVKVEDFKALFVAQETETNGGGLS